MVQVERIVRLIDGLGIMVGMDLGARAAEYMLVHHDVRISRTVAAELAANSTDFPDSYAEVRGRNRHGLPKKVEVSMTAIATYLGS